MPAMLIIVAEDAKFGEYIALSWQTTEEAI